MSVIVNDFDSKVDNSKRYTGVREVVISDSSEDQQMLAAVYEYKNENVLNMLTNEYVILKSPNGKVIDTLRYDGKCLVALSIPGSNNGKKKEFVPLIREKNAHQLCAIDMLNNPNIPIKFLAGTYGSGKTWLTTKMGLYHLKQNGLYTKIMIVRNPVGSGEKIGFLPGNKEEKTADFMKPIEQQLDGGEIELKAMTEINQLCFEIPFYMKGQSISGTWIQVEEAEDLDLKTLKLIGTRLAEGSAVVFSGDYNQAEKQFVRDNGLIQAIEKLKGNPLVGVVVLQEDVRSDASKVFANLD